MFFSFIIIDLQIDCIFLWYSSAGCIVNTYLRTRKCISHILTGTERLPDWGFYTKYSISITSKLFQCPAWDILLGIAILYAAWKVSVFVFFWSIFSLIWIEYGEILRISPYSVQMRENTDPKNFETETFYQLLRVTASYSKLYSV